MAQTSYCATHNTYPQANEPCWQCANPHIEKAYLEGKETNQKIIDDLLAVLKPFAEALSHQDIHGDEYDFDWSGVMERLTPAMFYDAQAAVAKVEEMK